MSTANSAGNELQVLMFSVSGCMCALPVHLVRDITHRPALAHLPAQPSILEGFFNYHGQPVAVVLLSRVLGLSDHQAGLYDPLLLLARGAHMLGFLVNAVEGVISVPSSNLQPIPENHSLNDCAVARFTVDDRTVALLAGDRILLNEERRRIEHLTQQALRRVEDLSAGDTGLPDVR